jgi:hypothetical protein
MAVYCLHIFSFVRNNSVPNHIGFTNWHKAVSTAAQFTLEQEFGEG